MIAALVLAALVFYALLYSGIANLRGDPTSTWQALTGAVAGPGVKGGVLGGGSTGGSLPSPTSITEPNPAGPAVVAAARRYLGSPYVPSGTTTRGVDCSGLVYAAYRDATGYLLPHSSATQRAGCVRITRGSLSPGDLIFWLTGSFHHVAIYLGGNQMIESAPSHRGVAIVPVGYQRSLGKMTFGRPRFLVSRGLRPPGGGTGRKP